MLSSPLCTFSITTTTLKKKKQRRKHKRCLNKVKISVKIWGRAIYHRFQIQHPVSKARKAEYLFVSVTVFLQSLRTQVLCAVLVKKHVGISVWETQLKHTGSRGREKKKNYRWRIILKTRRSAGGRRGSINCCPAFESSYYRLLWRLRNKVWSRQTWYNLPLPLLQTRLRSRDWFKFWWYKCSPKSLFVKVKT